MPRRISNTGGNGDRELARRREASRRRRKYGTKLLRRMPSGRLWCCGCGRAYVGEGNRCGAGHSLKDLERMVSE
jgi:hypothetical protein